jgi:hypothetical protein
LPDGKEQKMPARIESYKSSGEEPPLPPLTAQHIYDALMEVGPTEAGAMGPIPLSWREIDAWAARTFARPSAWEARLLRRLSAEYVNQAHLAEDRNCPAPWWPLRIEVDLEANERQLRAVLG